MGARDATRVRNCLLAVWVEFQPTLTAVCNSWTSACDMLLLNPTAAAVALRALPFIGVCLKTLLYIASISYSRST